MQGPLRGLGPDRHDKVPVLSNGAGHGRPGGDPGGGGEWTQATGRRVNSAPQAAEVKRRLRGAAGQAPGRTVVLSGCGGRSKEGDPRGRDAEFSLKHLKQRRLCEGALGEKAREWWPQGREACTAPGDLRVTGMDRLKRGDR